MTLHLPTTQRTPFIATLLLLIILLSPPTINGAPRVAWVNMQRKKPAHRLIRKQQQAKPSEAAAATGLKTYALRLRPGQDLRVELEKFTKLRGIRAGFILSAVGSLQKSVLRLANQKHSTSFEDKFEIVSLVGTLSPDGPHLHLSISDGSGKTTGGHLVEGSIIYTTAEIIIGELKGIRFTREQDEQTGSKELRIRRQ